jgi:lipoprotein-releasing system permease protein
MDRVKKEIGTVQSISPYVAKEAMIRSKENIDGVLLKGIDINLDRSIVREHLVSGTFLADNQTGVSQIVIGKKLANKLDVAIGDKLVVFGLPAGTVENLQPRAMQFQLVGIYESGMAEYDDIYAYTALGNAQKLFQYGDAVSGYEIMVNDISKVDDVAVKAQDLLGYPHYARTVFQLSRNLFSWVELQKKMSPILLGLIIIVATVNITGTLLMFVLEKTEAIGILKSLGAGPKAVQRIFLYQGFTIAMVGIILGNILSYTVCWLQLHFKILSLPSDIYYMSTVPILLRPENFFGVSLLTLLLCLATSLLPSRAAAKLDAISAIRFR